MDEQERLKELIEKPKQPNVSEWVYEVESFLEESGEGDSEAWVLIDRIKLQGDAFQYCSNLVALLKQIYKKKYNNVKAPQVMKKKQIFIAMMFSDATKDVYKRQPYICMAVSPLRLVNFDTDSILTLSYDSKQF